MNETEMNYKDFVHSLIAIHGGTHTPADATSLCDDVVTQSRLRLALEMQNMQFIQSTSVISRIESRLRGRTIQLMYKIGKQPSPSWLLGKFPATSSYQSLLLDLKPFNYSTNSCNATAVPKNRDQAFHLREIAVPFFPEMSSLQQQLSQSSLHRPIPGLYQYIRPNLKSNVNTSNATNFKDGLILRPLPSAAEDFRLPQPSIVCQCSSLSKGQEVVENNLGARTAKIGWRGGNGQNGSLMVSHPSIRGLDIRLVEVADEWVLNSYFDEAQDALLAASLNDLQSSHVITEGSEGKEKDIERRVDPKNLNADCWVETRANVKNPLGYFRLSKRWSTDSQKNAVAKPPDLPFE
jgi:hypothetical protein